MGYLYALTIYIWNQDYREGFFIGMFFSYDKAESTAKRYMREITGFKDYPCEYEIVSKKMIGELEDSNNVYMILGWNLNEASDEADIWESEVYVKHEQVEEELSAVRKKYEREEWCLSRYVIDKTYWEDGFVRV